MRSPVLAGVLLAACAPPLEPNFEAVREGVAARAGVAPLWNHGGPEERLIEETVREMLALPLDLDRAVKIALIHSPDLQARFAGLGVAQADFVAASSLDNPRVGLGVGLRANGGGTPLVQGGFTFGLLSALTLSARRGVASERRVAVELALTDAVIERVASVKKAFVAVQASLELERLAHAEAAAADAEFEAVLALHRDGTLDDRALRRSRIRHELERHALVRAEVDVATARERLNRLLGLWGAAVSWRIEEPLRGLPAEEVPLEKLETHAIASRLDLRAAKHRTAAFARALAAEGDLGWLRHLDVGAFARLEEDGSPYVGPSLEVEIPIFDRGEARVARLRNELLRSRFEVSDLAVTIRSRVREERAVLVAARRRVVHLRELVLPLAEQQAIAGSDATPTGTPEDARAALGVRREIGRALADYWHARFELERTVGGRLP